MRKLLFSLLLVFCFVLPSLAELGPFSTKLEPDGATSVSIQDQTTAAIILPLVRLIQTTTLNTPTTLYSYTTVVSSATGFATGQHIRIFEPGGQHFYFGEIIGIAGTTITVDSQINAVYPAGSTVTVSSDNLAVNGSITPVIFRLRTGVPSIAPTVDITRVLIQGQTSSAVTLDLFGNLPPLTRGLLFRRINSGVTNLFNIKTNADMAAIAYDFNAYATGFFGVGQGGFATRLTFAGQDKIGVALRIDSTSNLELVVQDDLTGLLQLRLIVEGHYTQD